ncbi:MAG: hypothetical protein ACKPH7_24840 [Planktothrix sp.]|uniref:hypothetical protein n=1 Tax=Planktothrix sp. TaxID=3088171 RepID=UPI0038D4D613
MTYSGEYETSYDTNNDNHNDIVVNHADWDGDGISHAISVEVDTGGDGKMDQFFELDPGSGNVISTGVDLTGDEVSDVVYTPDGDIQMADLNGDQVSTQEEMEITQAAIDNLDV